MKQFNRNIRITVRLNHAEATKLDLLCKDARQTPSQWVRDRIGSARFIKTTKGEL